jgi:hypothetical protein
MVMNDSLPTYCSLVRSNTNATTTTSPTAAFTDTEDSIRGRTAPDITLFHTNEAICVTNWQHQNPIRCCHHDVLSYTVDFSNYNNPLARHQRQPGKEKRTAISWSKVDWSISNESVLAHLSNYHATHQCPEGHCKQVHYYDKALLLAFDAAKKELPQGCCRDPILWCTNRLEELLEARNEAWAMATGTNNPCDWQHYKEIACKFAMELKNEKTRAWEQFSETLNYSSEPSKTMKVLKAINRIPSGASPNSILTSPNGKPVISSKGKANLFRLHFAKISKQPPHPKEQKQCANERRLKRKVRSYVKRNDLTLASLPFSLDELNIATSYLHCRKACGEDGIFNEFLILIRKFDLGDWRVPPFIFNFNHRSSI